MQSNRLFAQQSRFTYSNESNTNRTYNENIIITIDITFLQRVITKLNL